MNSSTSDLTENSIYFLDAYALIYRAYFAFIRNPRFNSKGLNTSAIFGFTNSLDEIIQTKNPSHIAVVFDPPGPNFRHEMYSEYKANRDATPEDIIKSVPYIKDIIKGFNIPVIEVQGYEADDVIGTLAKKAEKEGFEVFMVTPDKDFTQLVSEKIHMLKPGRGGSGPELWSVKEVQEKFMVQDPIQVIDVLALWGDAADNVPGAPGIGEKTSKKLISEFGSIENLFDNVSALKGKQRENIENNIDQIKLSKKLVTINQNVSTPFVARDLETKAPDIDSLTSLFLELEFKTISARILGRGAKGPAVKTHIQASLFDDFDPGPATKETISDLNNIHNTKHNYVLADTPYKRRELISELARQREFCFDTETTGLDVLNSDLVGLAFSYKEYNGWYVPFPESKSETRKILEEFSGLFLDEKITKIGQNLKFDIHILKNYDINVNGPLFDTMIAHYLIEPDHKHNLNFLAGMYLNYAPVEIEQLIGKKGPTQKSMRNVPLEEIKEYAAEDADISFQLKEILYKELSKKSLLSLADKIEMPLIPVLCSMERAGVKLDVEALNAFSKILRKELLALEEDIHNLAGQEFNISSPKQLGEILFEKLKISGGARKTKSKQYSTSEDVLVKLKDKHKIIPQVLEYRSLKKLLSTYVESLPKLISSQTGKIHTSFNQAIAATGRLSSTNPNLQNIPIREAKGREIRKAFIPSGPEYRLLSADYSQIELRLMAHMSEDEAMIEAFKKGEDIHAATAALIYQVKLKDVTREMRSRAKTANFGIIYGISAFGLSQRLNIPRQDAALLIEGYFQSYPGVKTYMDKSIKKARDVGYVETIMGRRRILNDISSRNAMIRGMAERNAINAPIQGSAADLIKLAMIDVDRALKMTQMRSKMILQVHDELVFDVYESETSALTKMIIPIMENVVSLRVSLKAEFGIGKNWLEAH
ncbi:MAG: DNA polymerase I [Bacteroidota bacterium]|nr:DNA polymerase I [Bacteroidota bacterium]